MSLAVATVVPRLLVAGDPAHGVVRCGRELADAVAADTGGPVAADRPGAGPHHLQVTDRLWGTSPEEAAARVVALLTRVPGTVTLHDLPQASDGPRNQARRGAAYARIARAARGVAVSSRHEAALLAAIAPEVVPEVIPLPVRASVPARRPTALRPEVALLGFFYPGKGHAEAIAAAAGTGLDVVVLGRASPGHEAELQALVADAATSDVRLEVTGWLSDDALLARARAAAVPLVAHRHVSASGSVGTWMSARRRPLVPGGPYWRELAALRPGTVTPYADLPAGIARAMADPDSTWLPAGKPPGPGPAEVAAAHLDWWRRIPWS